MSSIRNFANAQYSHLAIILILFFFLPGCGKDGKGRLDIVHEQDTDTLPTPPHEYTWDYLPVGGGGYVTGMVIHPVETDYMYMRTDVGGAYRWDPQDKSWIQMLDWIGPDNANLIGVDGMALDPNKPDRVYLALGKKIDGDGGVFRSEDRGKTWTRLHPASFEGNGREARWIGEPIAVDPHSSDIIYAGTRREGLFRSTDDGASWSKVIDVPEGYTGDKPTGIRSIVFDPANEADGKSSTIYVGVPEFGIYHSTDGGESFSQMPDSPDNPARMQVVDEDLYVTHSTGVALWSDGSWKDITPSEGAGRNYVALAVDETDNSKLVVAQRYGSFYNAIYRSSDKGETWAEINTGAVPANKHVDIPWWSKTRFSSATAAMAFVPGSSGELYYTDWFGVWQTPDVWAPATDWYTVVKGHEETVILTLVAPTDGALVYSGMADNFGFRHDAVDEYPEKNLYDLNEGFSIAVSEESPSHIAVLGATSWGGDNTRLATSSDYGETWTNRTLPGGTTLGKIAMSATDPDRMVYVAGGGAVYYTADGGSSWAQSEGAPENAIKLTDIWNKDFALAADLVNGDLFYLFNDGILYASSDGGASWTAQNEDLIPSQDGFLNVIATPNKEGEVWISLDGNGLWRTVNGGETFAEIQIFDRVSLFSWGAPAPEYENPTAYAYGIQEGQWGLYRSADMGNSWIQINDDEFQFPAGAKALAADRQTFGRVYIGTGGVGIAYGELAE